VRDVGVQKPCRYGTSGHGLAGTVVLGSQLDLMILEVFSNLNDSKKSRNWWHPQSHPLTFSAVCYRWIS